MPIVDGFVFGLLSTKRGALMANDGIPGIPQPPSRIHSFESETSVAFNYLIDEGKLSDALDLIKSGGGGKDLAAAYSRFISAVINLCDPNELIQISSLSTADKLMISGILARAGKDIRNSNISEKTKTFLAGEIKEAKDSLGVSVELAAAQSQLPAADKASYKIGEQVLYVTSYHRLPTSALLQRDLAKALSLIKTIDPKQRGLRASLLASVACRFSPYTEFRANVQKCFNDAIEEAAGDNKKYYPFYRDELSRLLEVSELSMEDKTIYLKLINEKLISQP